MDRKHEGGTTLQTEKKAELVGALKAYIYLIMNPQLNIEDGAFGSTVYHENATNDGTSYGIICCSDWGRKDGPSFGLTRAGVPQSF